MFRKYIFSLITLGLLLSACSRGIPDESFYYVDFSYDKVINFVQKDIGKSKLEEYTYLLIDGDCFIYSKDFTFDYKETSVKMSVQENLLTRTIKGEIAYLDTDCQFEFENEHYFEYAGESEEKTIEKTKFVSFSYRIDLQGRYDGRLFFNQIFNDSDISNFVNDSLLNLLRTDIYEIFSGLLRKYVPGTEFRIFLPD